MLEFQKHPSRTSFSSSAQFRQVFLRQKSNKVSKNARTSTMEGIAYTAPAGQEDQQAYILCADCGTPIAPNSANRCVNCLRNSVDITESIPKQSAISFCRNCSRWLSPPQAWLIAELESRELLAICLRKLKGLKEVRLVDAGFVWTEPHSKRLRVKLTVQKEVGFTRFLHASPEATC